MIVTKRIKGPSDPEGGVPRHDAEAFERFAGRERSALVAFAWALTGRFAEADELAQEALVAAWASWDRVGGYDRPRAWARRVLVNRASTRRRSAGREARALTRLAGWHDDGMVELPETDLVLWQAVRALPRRQARVVALRYVDDRSVAEIAEILGCSEGTVKRHLHRARLALARSLAPVNEEEDL